MENGSNPDPYLIVKKNNLDNGSNPDPKPQSRGKRENSLNPDPNSKNARIIWISVQIRIQPEVKKQYGIRFESGSKYRVKHNLENGLNPDPNIRTDRLMFLKIEPCLKMDSKMRHGAIF